MLALMIVSFLMFYLTTILKVEGAWHVPLRIFLFAMGFFFLIYGLSFAIQVVKADYEGGTSVMTEENYGNITAMTTSAFQTINTTTYIVMAWVLIAFLVGIILFARDMASNPSGINLDGEESSGHVWKKIWRHK